MERVDGELSAHPKAKFAERDNCNDFPFSMAQKFELTVNHSQQLQGGLTMYWRDEGYSLISNMPQLYSTFRADVCTVFTKANNFRRRS